jgi:hypothetical protein
MRAEEIRRKVLDPDGRLVSLSQDAWEHILLGHPELHRYESLVMATISHPHDREDDVRPERERYYTEGEGPTRYLCVVVEYIGREGDVITAFGHRNER